LKRIKVRKLSLCSCIIIKITFHKPSYKGVELCGSHVSYVLPFKDILTKEIIGCDTECEGLYYVDEVAHKGHDMLAHGTVTRQLWLWHRRLGHPSFGYLKILFPSLFISNTEPIKCETCTRAKNHRVTFPPNNNRVNYAFSLVHSDVWGPAPNSHNN